MLAHTPSLSLNRPSAGFYRAPVQSTTGRYHVKPPKFVNGHWIRPQNNRVACNEATASGGDWKKGKLKIKISKSLHTWDEFSVSSEFSEVRAKAVSLSRS